MNHSLLDWALLIVALICIVWVFRLKPRAGGVGTLPLRVLAVGNLVLVCQQFGLLTGHQTLVAYSAFVLTGIALIAVQAFRLPRA